METKNLGNRKNKNNLHGYNDFASNAQPGLGFANHHGMRASHTFTILALVAAFVLSGCGSTKTEDSESLASDPIFSGGGSGGGSSSSNNTPIEGPDVCGNENLDPTIIIPPITYSFDVAGQNNPDPDLTQFVSAPFQADSKLCVRVRSGPAGPVNIPGNNFTAVYGCVQYRVTVRHAGQTTGGFSQFTNVLAVGGGTCKDPFTGSVITNMVSQTMNLNSYLSGPDDYEIKIDRPQYDFYCKLAKDAYDHPETYGYTTWWYFQHFGTFPTPDQLGSQAMYYVAGPNACPMKNAFQNHILSGTLKIQSNGMLPP